MTLNLGAYNQMKDSGVPWLGELPEHWTTRPLKRWVRMNEVVLSESTPSDFTFQYVDIGSVGNGVLTSSASRVRFGESPSRARRVVREGDTILSTVRTYLKAIYFVDGGNESLVCSTGFAVLTPSYLLVPKFVSYVCQSSSFTDRVTAESVGIAYPAIAESRLGAIRVPLPPLPEQHAIVRYLDYMDRRIRRYIRTKQKLIKLLEEQKQAIINEAVTGKIDVRTGKPYPAYKDSGVKWLGMVPEGWEVRRLRSLADIGTGDKDTVNREDNGLYPFFVRSQTVERINSWTMDQEAVLTAGDGAGVAKVFHHYDGKFDFHQRVYCFRGFRGVSGRFFFEYLRATLRYEALAGNAKSTVDSLRRPMLQNFPVVVPSAVEQDQILEHISDSVLRIEESSETANRGIALLREYRTRLIADVVTGKLDVREAAAALPDEVEDIEGAAAVDGEELEESQTTDEFEAYDDEAVVDE